MRMWLTGVILQALGALLTGLGTGKVLQGASWGWFLLVPGILVLAAGWVLMMKAKRS